MDSRRGDGIRLSPMAKYASAPALLRAAKKELPGVPLPSIRWIYYQFHPTDPHTHASAKHTGRLPIKLKMQASILRAKHEDKGYCWHMWMLLREFAVTYRSLSSMFSTDEKKMIPCGNPGNFVQAVEKTRKVMCHIDGKWVSLDHGWSMNNIVPSVILKIDIPDEVWKSWYGGVLRVILKEKTFNCHDAAMRHTVENLSVCMQLGGVTPIMIHVHDGASDYNMTMGGALLAHLADYLLTGADLVISMRFCPYQSYNDPAERCMSLLNLGLQAVALARTLMIPEMERFMRGCGSMSDVRKLAVTQQFPIMNLATYTLCFIFDTRMGHLWYICSIHVTHIRVMHHIGQQMRYVRQSFTMNVACQVCCMLQHNASVLHQVTNPTIKAAVIEAMAKPIELVKERFETLEWTENDVKVLQFHDHPKLDESTTI